jgi:two-component system, sensor histidine kinase
MHILCVDDDEGLLYLLQSALESLSYRVTTCMDSMEVLTLLQTTHFDTVILDHEMPMKNGLEILKEVQTLAGVPPIIMVTGAGNEAIAVEAMRLGASDYVVKDVNLVYLNILPAVIQQVNQARRLIQERQAAQHLAQVEKERGRVLAQFLQDASHEFRIPLTIIQSSAELLERVVTGSKSKSHVAGILQQSNRILSLVDHLLLLAQIENTTSLQLAPVDLNILVQIALAFKAHFAAEKQLHVELNLSDQPMIVLASEDELVAAFAELIDNTRHAATSAAMLSITSQVEKDSAVVTLRDNGVGMTSEQLAHVMERFYRVDAAHKTPGFGLGLPIVASILKLHQGDLRITSEVGKGTEVTVTLPLSPLQSQTNPQA